MTYGWSARFLLAGSAGSAARLQPVCLSVCLSACLPVCLSACLSVYLSICLSVCPSVCLSAWLPICLSLCLSLYLPACLFVCLPACFCVCLSAYLFVWLPRADFGSVDEQIASSVGVEVFRCLAFALGLLQREGDGATRVLGQGNEALPDGSFSGNRRG